MTGQTKISWPATASAVLDTEMLEDLVSGVSDVAFLIDDSEKIVAVLHEPKARGVNLQDWTNENVRSILTVESVPKFEDRLAEFRQTGRTRPFELNHAATIGNWDAPVMYSLHDLRVPGLLMMLGRDLGAVSELQNQLVEAQLVLERDHERQRDFETRFRVLMASVDHAFLLASVDSGRIIDCNGPAASILGKGREELVSGSLANEFLGRRNEELIEALSTAARSDTARDMQLNVRRTGADVVATPVLFRAAGDRLVLLRLTANAIPKPGRGELSHLLTTLFQRGTDAVVFTDRDGIIQQINEAFLTFVDVAYETEVKDKPLSDFLVRGAVDFRVLADNAQSHGTMRSFVTKLRTVFDAEVPVEISATWLGDPSETTLAFVIRAANGADASAMTPADAHSAQELVGTATLKEIVAETTDVIERLCIENALEMTKNNRVAAAEMLGLSRQSLYVKLRKFGITGD